MSLRGTVPITAWWEGACDRAYRGRTQRDPRFDVCNNPGKVVVSQVAPKGVTSTSAAASLEQAAKEMWEETLHWSTVPGTTFFQKFRAAYLSTTAKMNVLGILLLFVALVVALL